MTGSAKQLLDKPLRDQLRRRGHVVFALALAALVAVLTSDRVSRGDRRKALIEALQKRGLDVAPEDPLWIDKPGVLLSKKARAIVRAAPSKGEPNDIFLVDAEVTPEGALLKVRDAYNLTETSSADESRPVVQGELIAYIARPTLAEMEPTVHVVDLGGQVAPGGDWSRLERLQNAIMNWQQTGQLRGIGKRTFAIQAAKGDASKDQLSLDFEPGKVLLIRSGGRTASLHLTGDATPPGWIRSEEMELSHPGNVVTWAVDRVRAIPWVGDDAMQTVKAIAFTALDFVLRNKEQVTGDTGAESIAADLGKTELEPATRTLPIDPEIGWPPSPLEPWVTPALPGEGQWHPLDNDPFVRRLEGLPPAFLSTFVRSDRTRKATRVYVALWDPRQVELHMMAGTVEPKGATGEAGPGRIPRTPEVMKRVIAASNAGFQAMHGEFGMMADGVVYLPPKEYGATVTVLRDGTTGFGTWPGNQTIPEGILSYRQNMTVMVQDEKFNPYGRTWWGGTPPGWADKTHTVRTGICLTKEHFIAYFYGADISPDALSQAMIQTRCAFGLALDMNAGHSGLEFYKVAPAKEFDPLTKPLESDWEAEGDVPGLEGWKFRGRRLIRGMGLMHFPRYIKPEGRDFFYMTLRRLLPGSPIAPKVKPAEPGEGEWRLKGLPQHGFPYALALTEVRPDPSRADLRVRVLKIDPRAVSSGESKAKTVALIDAGEPAGEAPSAWHSAGAFSIGPTAPIPGAVRLATGQAKPDGAVAVIGVHDEDGMLVYAEIVAAPAGPALSAAVLDELVKSLGCGTRFYLTHTLPIALGGDTNLAGQAIHPPSGATVAKLARAEAPGAKRVFEDTPIVPISVWYPLQQHRVRYFKKPAGATDDAAAGEENK